MTLQTYHCIVLLLCFSFIFCFGADILNCPKNQQTFEKLIGTKPNSQQNSKPFYRKNNSPVTLDCISQCAKNNSCTSFLLYYNSSECYSFNSAILKTQNYDYDSRPDTNVVWFRKTCLDVPNSCQSKAWAVEILAGATLVGHNTKKINGIITRQQCIYTCIQETSFLCKSVMFNVLSEYLTDPNPVGYCILSNTDRHLTPNAFRVSRYEDEYIENHCVNTTHSPEFCAYEEYDNTILEHTDLLLNMTQQQCQEICDVSLAFNCRGYSLIPSNNLPAQNLDKQTYTCLIHSEDSKLIGPKLLIHFDGAKYYERATCINVTVTCSNNLMSINYTPEEQFSGRIYISGYSDTPPCYSDGNYNATVQLNIPLNQSICGIGEAHTTEPWNRTLKSGLLVIQYNALIQTQADRLIKVGCVYGNNNINNDPEITLGTSVNFTNNYPNHGSTIVNNSTVLPTVSMKIVDYDTKKTTSDTEIGQELQMIIQITPGDGPYDIWPSNLIATSGNNTLQLLDEQGCPTSLNIFSPFTKIQTDSSRLLISNFKAFKFPSSPLVHFSVMVHFCTLNCPPMLCINEENGNRIKRNSNFESKEQYTNSVINATVYKINGKKNPNDTEEMIHELPLEILLFVRGVNIVSDQLVYGENNKILVAGYDILTNEVCLDYNLFVGLLVVWVLLQIIMVVCCFLLIRKYKKYFHIEYKRQLDDMHQNFDFGHRDLSRRVHWADE